MLNNKASWQGISRKITLAMLAALAALIVLTQTNPGTVIPNRDYGFYSYIGLQVLRGKLPYQDVWESKPPAIFYLNAAALSLGRGYRWGIWLVEFVFLLAAILFSYSLFKKLWGTPSALFGTAIWLIGMSLTLQGGNYTEEYPLPFHFLALTLFLHLIENPKQRLYALILGLLFSISFLFRPNNAVVEAVAILVFGFTLYGSAIGKISSTPFFGFPSALPFRLRSHPRTLHTMVSFKQCSMPPFSTTLPTAPQIKAPHHRLRLGSNSSTSQHGSD